MKVMKMLGPDPFTSVSVITVFGCLLKFLADGVTLTLYGHTLTLGHVDSATYVALLTPVLGAHGYIRVKGKPIKEVDDDVTKV